VRIVRLVRMLRIRQSSRYSSPWADVSRSPWWLEGGFEYIAGHRGRGPGNALADNLSFQGMLQGRKLRAA
jgi:hypothetical protein